MRSFHALEGFEPPTERLLLPDNITLLATHGSREIPSHFVLSEAFSDPEFGVARLKDFSDFGTGLVLEHFDPRSVITPPRYGRIGGDGNRGAAINRNFSNEAYAATFRSTNMSGVMPLWEKGDEPTEFQQMLLLDENHSTYFDKITAKVIEQLEQTTYGPILFVDLHDTGDGRLLPDGSVTAVPKRIEKYGRTRFWEAVIGDKNGSTARPQVTHEFTQALTSAYEQFGVPHDPSEILVNEYYKGGFVTGFIGERLPKKLVNIGIDPQQVARINAIQLEIPRHRYMTDEAKQDISPELIAREALLQHRLLEATGNAIRTLTL